MGFVMSTMASQITGFSIVYSTICSGTDQRKPQSSASLAFASRNHRWPVDSSHKGPVTRKMFPFDDVTITKTFIGVPIGLTPYVNLEEYKQITIAIKRDVFKHWKKIVFRLQKKYDLRLQYSIHDELFLYLCYMTFDS